MRKSKVNYITANFKKACLKLHKQTVDKEETRTTGSLCCFN